MFSESIVDLIKQQAERLVQVETVEESLVFLDTTEDPDDLSVSIQVAKNTTKGNEESDSEYDLESDRRPSKALLIEERMNWSVIEKFGRRYEETKNVSKVAKQFNKDYQEARRIIERYQQGPTEAHKATQLRTELIKKFKHFRSLCLTVHDCHLVEWTNQLKYDLKINNLSLTNPSTIQKFKRENGIVSRHITHYVTRKKLVDEEKLKEDWHAFVDKINESVANQEYSWSDVYNSDQTKMNFEIVSKRTNSIEGKSLLWHFTDQLIQLDRVI